MLRTLKAWTRPAWLTSNTCFYETANLAGAELRLSNNIDQTTLGQTLWKALEEDELSCSEAGRQSGEDVRLFQVGIFATTRPALTQRSGYILKVRSTLQLMTHLNFRYQV